MKTAHPIDHAIAAVLLLVEGACWIVNELAGFHAEPEIEDPRDTIAIEAPIREVFHVETDSTLDTGSHAFPELDWEDMNVAELRRSAKGLAKGLHLMRRGELLELLTTF